VTQQTRQPVNSEKTGRARAGAVTVVASISVLNGIAIHRKSFVVQIFFKAQIIAELELDRA
jgi:hypothetical protein